MLGSHRADLDLRFPRQPSSGATSPADHPQHLRRILEHTVAPVFAVASSALWLPTRGSRAEAFARQVAMYLAHIGLGLSQRRIARLFARDRSTVAHACALIEDRRDSALLDRSLDLLEGALRLVSPRPV
ncbi:MAG TPA: helix-turn-helix domain-containing protein [Hyphomicrobiaceae bacterium]|nr:helix-turn-helix domain-containing protein [Hyphomicrobiaceae bacterium]